MLSAGARLGPYEILSPIGAGGMGEVYRAHDARLRRDVALKVLPERLAQDPVGLERFTREARAVAALNHPHIVTIFSTEEAGGVRFFTMELIEGRTLDQMIPTSGVSLQQFFDVGTALADALDAAHRKQITHRDLKPANVMVSDDGRVKVLDFGLARAAEPEQEPSAAEGLETRLQLTAAGTILGTLPYMSPEQIEAKGLDHRSDVFSLGVILYEIATGGRPFRGDSSPALLSSILKDHPRSVHELRADVPPDVSRLVGRCLEKQVRDRVQTAHEVLIELRSQRRVWESGARATLEPKPAQKPSLAVLPFANLSPDPADEYFADGLTDELITDLSPLHGLRVIARASMMRFKGSGKDPAAVASELGVRYVLDGSVRRAGSSLRITARLFDGADGATLWSEKLGGTLDDVFAMQEKISRTIAGALELTLTPQHERRLAERKVADLQAYEAFLQARQAMWTFSASSLARAASLLESAVGRIGDDALLLGALGHVHIMFLETGDTGAAEHLLLAQRCAARLRAIAPQSFEFHWLDGLLHFRRGAIREAIDAFARARVLQPNSADVACMQCYMYILAGKDAEARQAADDSIAIDPLTPLLQCMPGFCEWVQGRYDAAEPHYRRYAELDPLNPSAQHFLVQLLANAGKPDEARSRARTLAEQSPGTVYGQIGRVFALAFDGAESQARAAITPGMRASTERSEVFARMMAELCALCGDVDSALGYLERAVHLGNAHYPFLARHDRLLAPLRDQPRFRSLMELVRARWERGGASASDRLPTD